MDNPPPHTDMQHTSVPTSPIMDGSTLHAEEHDLNSPHLPMPSDEVLGASPDTSDHTLTEPEPSTSLEAQSEVKSEMMLHNCTSVQPHFEDSKPVSPDIHGQPLPTTADPLSRKTQRLIPKWTILPILSPQPLQLRYHNRPGLRTGIKTFLSSPF